MMPLGYLGVSATLRTMPASLGGPEQTSFVPASRSEKQRTYQYNTRTGRKDESDSENGEVGSPVGEGGEGWRGVLVV